MKNYTITVNGVAYDVTVEEKGAGAAQAAKPAAFAAAAAPAPAVSAPAAGGAAFPDALTHPVIQFRRDGDRFIIRFCAVPLSFIHHNRLLSC